MVRCEVIEEFTLQKFNELKEVKRIAKNEDGRLFPKDTFLCDEKMAEYLTGNNVFKKTVVKVIEVIPDEKKTKKTTKKTSEQGSD